MMAVLELYWMDGGVWVLLKGWRCLSVIERMAVLLELYWKDGCIGVILNGWRYWSYGERMAVLEFLMKWWRYWSYTERMEVLEFYWKDGGIGVVVVSMMAIFDVYWWDEVFGVILKNGDIVNILRGGIIFYLLPLLMFSSSLYASDMFVARALSSPLQVTYPLLLLT